MQKFEIREEHRDHYFPGSRAVSIRIEDVESLPAALRRLAELGYDMTPSLNALQAACEEQRKRKALDEAVKAMAEKPA